MSQDPLQQIKALEEELDSKIAQAKSKAQQELSQIQQQQEERLSKIQAEIAPEVEETKAKIQAETKKVIVDLEKTYADRIAGLQSIDGERKENAADTVIKELLQEGTENA